MAKQALIICAGGMSSSMIAKKTMALLQEQGEDIEMDAVVFQKGKNALKQTTMISTLLALKQK